MNGIDRTGFLLVDVQGRLAGLVQDSERVIAAVRRALQACRILDIPVWVTEQVPEKIGATVPEIQCLCEGFPLFTKTTFSAMASADVKQALDKSGRPHVLVAGIETHVCVYQTVRDLIRSRYQVTVLADGVSSRFRLDHDVALEHMRGLGARILTTEMAACELIGGADDPRFRDILALLKAA